MGVLSSLLKPKTEERSSGGTAFDLGLGYRTRAGVEVTPTSALSMTAVWACVRVVSESVASLPLFIYRRRADGGKDKSTDHPLYRLLHDQPNAEMSAFELREMMAAHLETWGNAYASIEWSAGGQAVGLWPLNPARMEQIERVGGRLMYGYRLPSQQLRWLQAKDVLHVRGLSGDGFWGYSPIRVHMEAIGLGMATERYGAAFFGNGARPGGLLTHPSRLSDQAYGRLQSSFNADHQGIDNAHRLKILEEGMGYQAVGIPPDEAQFLETRKFQVAEIARIFRIPPHMIQDLDRATFSNVEQQSIDFVVYSLRPRLVRFEQAYHRQLMTQAERVSYFVEHLVDGLLRGDIASRYAAYNTAIQAGFMSRNEVRGLENLNPADNLDAYLVPLNMIEAGQSLPEPLPPTRSSDDYETRDFDDIERRAQSTAADRQSIARAQEKVLLDAMARIVRREVNDIGRAVDKYLVRADDTTGFLLWLDEFYQEHADFINRNLRAGFSALLGLVVASVNRELDTSIEGDALSDFLDDFLLALSARWADGNAQQLRAIVRDEKEIADALKERLDSWESTEAEKNARRDTFRAVNAFAYAAYGAAAVRFLRWVARGENCPYCRALNGRIVGYNETFVGEGDFQPDGADTPMVVRRRTKHAPLHDGCDCQVIASR